MGYAVLYSEGSLRSIKKIDPYQARIIISWIEKNLVGCDNPRLRGEPLLGDMKGYWRYRIGDYRVIAEILDNLVRIEIIRVGHRREVYDK